jgi:hypothetical protein
MAGSGSLHLHRCCRCTLPLSGTAYSNENYCCQPTQVKKTTLSTLKMCRTHGACPEHIIIPWIYRSLNPIIILLRALFIVCRLRNYPSRPKRAHADGMLATLPAQFKEESPLDLDLTVLPSDLTHARASRLSDSNGANKWCKQVVRTSAAAARSFGLAGLSTTLWAGCHLRFAY